MTETDDIVARLQDMAEFLGQTFVVDPDKLARFRRWEAAHITRLEERCDANKAQTNELEAEIERLTQERDNARRYCSAAYRDYTILFDGLTSSDNAHLYPRTIADLQQTSEFMKLAAEGKEDGTVYEDELTSSRARAESAEREVAALKEEVGRLREALERMSSLTPGHANTSNARSLHLTVKAIADTALQPQEPKP